MPRVAPDTSVIVATLCAWHERHEWARTTLETRLDRGAELVVAAHSLAESYAVLTRLPPPHRVGAEDAFTLIDDSFARRSRVVAVPPRGYRALLRRAVSLGVAGGRTYDAVIAWSVELGEANEIVTLNPAHFSGLAGAGIAIVAPP